MRYRRILSALLAVVFSGAWAGSALASEFPRDWFFGEDRQREAHAELEGKPAPELKLSHWMNKELAASDLKGKIVVVDFWATWCGPCIAGIPKNNSFYEKYQDKGVELIGVCGSPSGQEKMGEVAEQRGITYPIARDATLASARAWRVMWWPTYGVIDRQGRLRALGLKPNAVEEVVKKLLEEPAPSEDARADATPRE